MSLAFPNLSWWLWSGKRKDVKLEKKYSLKSSPEFNVMELDMVTFLAVNGSGGNLTSNSGRASKPWRGQELGKIDKEFDVVLVPSDEGFSSDSESDASDWSIGWSEPHASGFLSEDEIDGGFGVLVRCYGHRSREEQDHRKDVTDNKPNVPGIYSADGKKYMEQWLSTLQGN